MSGTPSARTHLTHEQCRAAAEVLWGGAGAFAVDEFQRLNLEHFDGNLPLLPIVIGITAYGRCIGLTRGEGAWRVGKLPRITLASNVFALGEHEVSDVLVHEMIHAQLMLEGKDPKHNGMPWCEEITRLSPAVLGRAIAAEPVKTRRIKDDGESKVIRLARDGFLDRKTLARWPHSLRPEGYDRGQPLAVESY